MNYTQKSKPPLSSHNSGQSRIDLENYVPDFRKSQNLKRRLYDSGISNQPMPSVVRPIEEKIASRPFSAKMSSTKIQASSPMKQKIQDLNTNIISNLNQSYKLAAAEEAKYKGEGTQEYYRSQHIVVPQPKKTRPQTAGRKLQGRMGVSVGQPRMTGQLSRPQSSRPGIMSPINTNFDFGDHSSAGQPRTVKNNNFLDPERIMPGPPNMMYAGFEGGPSLSQKNLEQARSRYLLDKLTGKLPPEFRISSATNAANKRIMFPSVTGLTQTATGTGSLVSSSRFRQRGGKVTPSARQGSARQGSQRGSARPSDRQSEQDSAIVVGGGLAAQGTAIMRQDSGANSSRRNLLTTKRRISGQAQSTKQGVAMISSHQQPQSSMKKQDEKAFIKPTIITDIASENTKKPKKNHKWSDLDKYIELLLDSKSEEETVFVYLVPHSDADPYDLRVVDYSERANKERYYTLSSKGLTTYINEKPSEFQTLGQWLIERDSYNHIKELSFFKQFKSWKFMRMWKRTIKMQNRLAAINSLEENLFMLQDHFREHLSKHRSMMLDMSRNKFVDTCETQEPKKLEEFAKAQMERRERMQRAVADTSLKSRANIKACVDKVLMELRHRIVGEITLEEKRKTSAPQAKQGAKIATSTKRKDTSSNYDKLGFPAGMTYAHRSSLRKECMRFLRFAYLVDFLSLESLSQIYIGSLQEMIRRLETLDDHVDMEIIMSMQFDDQSGVGQAQRGREPLFYTSVTLDDRNPIPEDQIEKVVIDDFVLPPRGTSVEHEFDLLAHIELEDEKGDQESEDYGQDEEALQLRHKIICPRIQDYWIKLLPGKQQFIVLMLQVFKDGLSGIRCFERWSKHQDLEHYANALEDWDDLVGDDWNEPDSPYLDPQSWIVDHPVQVTHEDSVTELIGSAYDKANQFLARFQPLLEIYWRNKQFDINILVNESTRNQVECLSNTLKLLKYQKNHFEANLPNCTDIGLVQIDSEKIKKKLAPTPKELQEEVEKLVPKINKERTDEVKMWLKKSISDLQKPVADVSDFVKQKQDHERISENFNGMRDKIDLYGQFYAVLAELGANKVKKDEKDNHTEAEQMIKKLTDIIAHVESKQESENDRFKRDLAQMIPVLRQQVAELAEGVSHPKYLDEGSDMKEMITQLDEKLELFKQFESTGAKYNMWQEHLGTPLTRFDDIDTLREEVTNRHIMWHALSEWQALKDGYEKTLFIEIEAEEIAKQADKYGKIATRLEKSLPENPIQRTLKILVDTFKGAMPIVTALRNPNLLDKHWEDINELIDGELNIREDEEFTLQNLIELDVVQYMDDIVAISLRATGEHKLINQWEAINAAWKEVAFSVVQHKDAEGVWVLAEVDDLYTFLDENLAQVNMILGNRYAGVIRDKAVQTKKDLNTLNNAVDEWITVQQEWMYLETIFKSPEIKKTLPQEQSLFDGVHRFFLGHMAKVYKTPKAAALLRQTPNLVENLANQNAALETIRRKITAFLETRRVSFPRFYFLSDEELLKILANADDREILQNFLKVLFDGINRLNEDEVHNIEEMVSKEGEVIKFLKPVKSSGSVEVWLGKVQEVMKETLAKLIKEANRELMGTTGKPPIPRKEWVLAHPAQIVTTVQQIQWCYTTEEAILNMCEDPACLQQWYDQNCKQLDQLTQLVRGQLSELQRAIIVALITQDVHARDIVDKLKVENTLTTYDFSWQQQLRYYYEEEIQQNENPVQIRQIQAQLYYGYEYMGATSRLVITPLTDKCWITITGALHIKLGANPAGPAGTGKTESVKDLAKGIAIFCVVFNCSEQIDYKQMQKHFSGLVQQGCWTCLDEFNRIDVEVLSVIAQQLLTIRKALLANKEEFEFEGSCIKCRQEFGCHITMNPGYAGRTELPDNLKVLFRPVAMMIPSYGLIAEVMLFAEGFGESSTLSKKMVQLYKLSSEQLSQQDHYDFGMRAVKSVLVMAGDLKRANPEQDEDAVLIRAMKDANVPKFLKDDLPLFQAIVQDLFPNFVIQETDYSFLTSKIRECLALKQLQPHPPFMTKVIELFETFNVRFGVMLVGFTGAGKTTCYQTLADVMTSLRKEGHESKQFQLVNTTILNPKAISMGELYGQVDLITQEWTDGLASKYMRADSERNDEEKCWTVFDGPVDSLWIENMNTVLDDNMTLCLANGQRLKLRNQMRMLFEVQDLAEAAPSTVSRCGMVYLTADELGWRPYVQSWILNTFPDESVLEDSMKDYLWDLFDQTIDIGIEKMRSGLTEPIPTANLQQVKSVCNFLGVLISGDKSTKMDEKQKKKELICIFAFAYTHGMGSSLDEKSKDYFDTSVRDTLKAAQFPAGATVFDFFYDQKKAREFISWETKLQTFSYVKDSRFFDLFVDTATTYRHSWCLEQLLEGSKSAFFTGESGVGKSVIIQNTFQKLSQEKDLNPIYLNFSAQTDSKRTQQSIQDKLEKITRTVLGAPAGKRNAVFVDDINMPFVEKYGAQPPIELLRLFMDKNGLFERADWQWKQVTDTTLIAAAAPPVGGRYPLTPRFTTNFNMFCVPEASETVLQKIFGSILGGFLKAGFQDNIQSLCDACVNSTIEVYTKISAELRATPAKFHYLFNLRDVSKVVQGIMMARPVSITSPDSMARLWVNEACRVFQDRLINNHDSDWLVDTVMDMVSKNFKSGLERDDMFGDKKLMFTDLHKLDVPVKLYEEIKDQSKLIKQLNGYLEEYNYSSSNKMNLVFFQDAVLHILRICRTLRQPRGNIMLIGVGGSGKQSLTRLSSYMYEMSFKQIEIVKGYSEKNFHEFLKEMMFMSGVDARKVTFTINDSQILKESFLEDINNILNTGEVPNLMQPEDKERVQNDCRQVVIDMKLEPSADIIQKTFVTRVRENFHICLCMSPVGDDLRLRCRQFPSIVNCCTLDWFTSWPDEALLFVSNSFLKELDLPQEFLRKELAEMCKLVHTSVEKTSEKFYNELRRRVYTTPKSYLDLISVYLNTLEQKRKELNLNRNRLASGLQKLNDTNDNIAQLKISLAEMQPILEEKNDQLKLTLDQVQMDKLEADAKEAVVMEEKEVVEKRTNEAKAVQDEAEHDLKLAQPELDKAIAAVQKLEKNDIVELKSFTAPPPAVVMTMEPVMMLLGHAKDWKTAKAVMGDATKFLAELKGYDVKTMKERTIQQIRKDYFRKENFNPSYVGDRSKPAGALCTWLLALSNYQTVYKNIVPKQVKLAEMQAICQEAQAIYDEKLSELKKVQDAVTELEEKAQRLIDEKEELEQSMRISKSRMERAEKLVVLLADEGVRWKETVEVLAEELVNLVGDVFLSCACISYFGGFTGTYREELCDSWSKAAVSRSIPCTQPFSLIKVMGDPMQIKNWNMNFLPSDRVSLENGILATKAERWGLCVDPQKQANRWLKSMLKDKQLMTLNMSKPTLLRDITGAIRNGVPVLIEDLEEQLNPGIDPILSRQEYIGEGGLKQIKLGDAVVDYDDNFKLFMTTKLPNPHYPPEVCIKVTIVNFTVTTHGLEEQLLADVVVKERADVEAKRDEIVVQMDKDQRTLKKIENDILKLLNESEIEAILDADTLINVLDESKVTSAEIHERLADAKVVEEEINETRNKYTPVAVRGQILYFVIADMAMINDMYQNSLQFVKVLFNKAIDESEQSEDISERIENLIDTITKNIYSNISRGLFEADKLIFTYLMATGIKRHEGIILPAGWNLLLRGAQPLTKEQEKEKPKNPLPDLLNKLAYDMVHSAEILIPAFDGIVADLAANEAGWSEWASCEYPEKDPLPGDWEEKLTDFQKTILLKCFRPEKIMFAFKDYVQNNMGNFFVESQAVTMDMLFKDTDCRTPLIFILSTGADPMQNLLKFAAEREMSDQMGIVSLGQGQSEKALKLIDDSIERGDWVVLQNCHLARNFMPDLEEKISEFQDKEMEAGFRLFLTSDSVPFFPVSVLQNGIKNTTEPPRGIKANLKRTWAEITDSVLEDCKKQEAWNKLVFGLTFFHAVVQERRKFGPLGWNIVYEFNDSDLDTSKTMLKIFLDDQDDIPWDALVYVTGEINYGGRVTDDKDNRCLITMLQKYYNEDALIDDYYYSDSEHYRAPPLGSADSYRLFIQELPQEEKPEVFGLHDNANIAYQRQESQNMLDKILSIQPRISGASGGGMSPDELVLEQSRRILSKVPEDLLRQNGLKDLFKSNNNLLPSLTTVLLQEMEKFNRLLAAMRKSLQDLDKAIHGIILMSSELDQMYLSFQNGKVPPNWEVVAYPSLKPLASWFDDLVKRVDFMQDWLAHGNPNSYWLSGMYFPQGFLTGVLQTHARQYKIAIDQLSFQFEILEQENPDEIEDKPENGVYIYGLFMDGARYNREYKVIDEQYPAVLYDTVPLIHFQPVKDFMPNPEEYQCPLYKTGARAGVLSTTGQSTNYILSVQIPTSAEDEKPPAHWIKRAAALLCQLND